MAIFSQERGDKMKTFKLTMPKTKAEARSQAIDWQKMSSEVSMSYADILDSQNHFLKLGKKFGLIREFKENGIF